MPDHRRAGRLTPIARLSLSNLAAQLSEQVALAAAPLVAVLWLGADVGVFFVEQGGDSDRDPCPDAGEDRGAQSGVRIHRRRDRRAGCNARVFAGCGFRGRNERSAGAG